MLSLVTAIWLFKLYSVSATFVDSKFHAEKACDYNYGNIIETINAIRSTTECSEQCSKNSQCLSIKYDAVNKVCRLNSERYMYLGKDCLSQLNFAKKICHESTDCTVPNSQCFLNKCQCDPGYSYNFSIASCVTSCHVYGSTFSLYYGYHIRYNNDEIIYAIDSVDICKKACLDYTKVVCLTADFYQAERECYLSGQSAFTKPSYFETYFDAYHHHRNCELENQTTDRK